MSPLRQPPNSRGQHRPALSESSALNDWSWSLADDDFIFLLFFFSFFYLFTFFNIFISYNIQYMNYLYFLVSIINFFCFIALYLSCKSIYIFFKCEKSKIMESIKAFMLIKCKKKKILVNVKSISIIHSDSTQLFFFYIFFFHFVDKFKNKMVIY